MFLASFVSLFFLITLSQFIFYRKFQNIFFFSHFSPRKTEQFENFSFVWKLTIIKITTKTFSSCLTLPMFFFSKFSFSFFLRRNEDNQFQFFDISLVIKNVVRKIEWNYFTSGHYKKQKWKKNTDTWWNIFAMILTFSRGLNNLYTFLLQKHKCSFFELLS